jgi:hypothetical protein
MDSSPSANYYLWLIRISLVNSLFSSAVWFAGIAFELCLLYRSWRGRVFTRYPIFFLYISFVLFQSLLRYVYRVNYPEFYGRVYWTTEFLGIFFGCGIVFEFYKIGLANFPGAAKFTRNALLFVFSMTVGKIIVTAAQGSAGWSGALTVQLVRDMRFVQVAAVITLVALFLIYSIPAGRNLLGIVVGYGMYLGISVLNLTYLDLFRSEVMVAARYIQSSGYLISLILWTITLWSYRPAVSSAEAVANSGYPSILDATSRKLVRTDLAVRDAIDS